MTKARYQNQRSDPSVVALSYAIFIVGFPIRLALNYLLPCPDAATLRFLRRTISTAAFAAALSFAGLLLLIMLGFVFSYIESIRPGVSETTGPAFRKLLIGLLAIIFGGLILTTGLHGYLKNFPSVHADD